METQKPTGLPSMFQPIAAKHVNGGAAGGRAWTMYGCCVGGLSGVCLLNKASSFNY